MKNAFIRHGSQVLLELIFAFKEKKGWLDQPGTRLHSGNTAGQPISALNQQGCKSRVNFKLR